MNNNDYLEKLLGEQYNMKNYFVDTYAEPHVDVIETMNQTIHTPSVNTEPQKEEQHDLGITKQAKTEDGNNVSDLEAEYVSTTPKQQEVSQHEKVNEQQVSSNNEPVNSNPKELENIENTPQKENEMIDYTEEYVPRQYQAVQVNNNISDIYPKIYKVLDPIVELSVGNIGSTDITEETVESMATRIYSAVEPERIHTNDENDIPVNGRPYNNLLHDLIKILILNKLKPMPPKPSHNRRPPMPPPHNQRPCNHCNNMRVSNNINYQDLPYPEDDV